MAAIPVFTDGQVVHQADLRFLLSPPEVVGGSSLSAAQSIPNATPTAVQWQAPSEDPDGMWASGNPSRFTVVTPGLWLIESSVVFGTSAAGSTRWIYVTKNAAGYNGQDREPAGTDFMGLSTSAVIRAVAGDYFETYAYQSTGGALSLIASQGQMICRWLNP